jgi:hypothetical protein
MRGISAVYWDLEKHEWYAHGDCGLLAITIHEITGWDLVFSPDWPCTTVGCAKRHDGGPHMLVRHPSGKYVDIDGMHDERENVTVYDYSDEIEVRAGLFGLHTFNLGLWRANKESVYELTEKQIHHDALNVVASTMFADRLLC